MDSYRHSSKKEVVEEVKFIPDSLRSHSPSTFEIIHPSIKQQSFGSEEKGQKRSSLKEGSLGKRAAAARNAIVPANQEDPENRIGSGLASSKTSKKKVDNEGEPPRKRQKLEGTDQIVSLQNSSSDHQPPRVVERQPEPP
eukprot:CAMPEP_0170488280 /NCGR_PEP_ID=MMETSP0208-20121228/6873_1 /TAXON_ID=197538 /ORGANISM="Strombidium inclinatum, Strain S3" /LENGTH=139 /DNA_ID=CAMNT_0010762807 /DNA_START=614 /DNA_END=1033 /DNA_ORIENTATION=-